MSVIQNGLFTVLNRFPERGETVKQLFKQDDAFQSLCEDYIKCRQALQYWRNAESSEAPARRQEYEALLSELESELLETLDGFKLGGK